jgi:hypothetical protein
VAEGEGGSRGASLEGPSDHQGASPAHGRCAQHADECRSRRFLMMAEWVTCWACIGAVGFVASVFVGWLLDR